MESVERYHRLSLIEGWEQSKLDAEVAFIGSGPLAHFALAGTAVTGVKKIKIYDSDTIDSNKNEFLFFRSRYGKAKAKSLESVLNQLNPDVSIKGINIDIEYQNDKKFLGKPKLIVDTTNSPESKLIAAEAGKKLNIPVILASTSETAGVISVYFPENAFKEQQLFENYRGKKQGAITSCIFGGLVLREIIGLLMPRQNEEKIEDIISYNLNSEQRVLYLPLNEADVIEHNIQRAQRFLANNEIDSPEEVEHLFRRAVKNFFLSYNIGDGKSNGLGIKKDALVIGAGALGNYVSLLLALSGVKRITIMDDDEIEETNLNRQIFYCFDDTIDKPKAKTLANILQEINPDIEIDYINKRLTLKSEKKIKNYDLFVSAVDNFKTDALINFFSTEHDIPLTSGGVTDYKAGRTAVYFPSKNACLDHQVGIDSSALRAHNPTSCIYSANPSIATNNIIISGFMIAEAKPLLQNSVYKKILPGVMHYISRDSCRIGINPVTRKCDCYKNGGRKEWLSKMKHLYSAS